MPPDVYRHLISAMFESGDAEPCWIAPTKGETARANSTLSSTCDHGVRKRGVRGCAHQLKKRSSARGLDGGIFNRIRAAGKESSIDSVSSLEGINFERPRAHSHAVRTSTPSAVPDELASAVLPKCPRRELKFATRTARRGYTSGSS